MALNGIAAMRKVLQSSICCTHENTEREDYLNARRFAGCDFQSGSQYRLWCADCGALLYDSAAEDE